MKVESPPVGGGPSSRGSPPSDHVGQMASKSPRDVVDAAVMIAGLSRLAAPCHSEMTLTFGGRRLADHVDAGSDDRELLLARSEAVPPRFAHIKSAVMPERHSFVQKALKRKIENRIESTTVAASSFNCQATEAGLLSHQEPSDAVRDRSILKAIESERGYFGSVKRCRMAEVEAFKSEDLGGRFVRTGRPCTPNEDSYPNLPYTDMARYVKTKCEDLSSEMGGSNAFSVGRFAADDSEFVRRRSAQIDRVRQNDRYSPMVVQEPNVPVATLQMPKFYENTRVDNRSRADADGSVAGIPVPVGSVSKNRVIHGTDFGHIPCQPSGCVASAKEHPQHHGSHASRMDLDNLKKRDNLSAYYSLGRQHASTLTSPARVPVLNGQKTLSRVTQHGESRMSYLPGKNERPKFYSSIRSACIRDENNKVRVLDSRTEKKVKSGEFGMLRTLKDYYNKLGPKTSTPEKPAVRGRLGSITNGRPQPSYQNVGRTNVSTKYASYVEGEMGEEMAIDLSVHSRRMPTDREESRYELLKLGHGTRRKSRSCCSSPSMVLDLATRIDASKSRGEQCMPVQDEVSHVETKKIVSNPQRWLVANANSLPSSPFTYFVDQEKLESHYSSTEGCADKQMTSAVKVDSRLPLKKRRLLDVGNPATDATSLPPSPQAEISNSFGEQYSSTVKNEHVLDDGDAVRTRDSPTLISAIVHGDEEGDLPLHRAVEQGNLNLIERILDIMCRLEMSLDCYNSLRQTPLHVAVSSNQPAIVRRLLKSGASPNLVDQNGQTSIHYAAKLASSECLKCLLEHSKVRLDIDAVSYSGQTALHVAVQSNNTLAATMLIDAGARIDACDGSSGRTPLLYAFEQNNLAMAKILLANGASPNWQSYSTTPIPFSRKCRADFALLHDKFVAADVKG